MIKLYRDKKTLAIIGRVRKNIAHNFWLKFVAVFLAIALWFSISHVVTTEVVVKVPLKVKLGNNMSVREKITEDGMTVKNLQIVLSGPKDSIAKMRIEDIEAVLDLTGYTIKDPPEKIHIVDLLSSVAISKPAEVKVEDITPPVLLVTVDEIMKKLLPVKVDITGIPAAGYKTEQVRVEPEAIYLTGPAGVLKELKHISTVPINIEGITRSTIFKKVALRSWSGDDDESEYVKVYVGIGPESGTRSYDDIPVKVLHDASQVSPVSLSPGKITVTMEGQQTILNTIVAADIKVFVDIVGLQPGRYELPIEVKISPALLTQGVSMKELSLHKTEVIIEPVGSISQVTQ